MSSLNEQDPVILTGTSVVPPYCHFDSVNACHHSPLSRQIVQSISSDKVLRRVDSRQLANQITCDNLKMKMNDITAVCLQGSAGV